MSFDQFETSNANGRPIALYTIKWGNSVWRYTSADSEQTWTEIVSGVPTVRTFLPISIRDDGMTQGGSTENDFQVHCQSDIPVVALFADSPPTSPVTLVVRRKHADDPDDEAPVYWIGRISNVVKGENQAEADLRGISIAKLLKSGGLRLTWNKNCPHCIYDSECKVDAQLHRYGRTVVSVVGSTLTVDQDTLAPETSFTGGFVEWDRDGLGTLERRGIEMQIDARTVKVLGRMPGLVAGLSVGLYPGCDQTTSTCDGAFDNIDNNGGFWFMPEKSPFDGTQVFD